MEHTFFVHFFAVVLHEYNEKFPETSYTFYGGNVVRVLVYIFSLPLIFTLHWWPLAYPTYCHRRYKIFMLFFLSLALCLCRPFSRWSSLACRLLSLFLCLSPALYSKFVDILDNEFKLNTLDNTDTEAISAINFRLYRLCLCFTRLRWLCYFPPK